VLVARPDATANATILERIAKRGIHVIAPASRGADVHP
jgi:ABC-type sugar transport system substrate-binding protein